MLEINEAIKILLSGQPLILPTDTLYGLGAIAYDYFAVKNIFDLKKRSYSKALPVHYGNIELVRNDCVIKDEAYDLMQKYWPGALTIVVEKKKGSRLQFVNDYVAVRVPNNKILLDILNTIQVPLVMPSANISNEPNIFYFDTLHKIFNIEGIKDDSSLKMEESTIISFENGKVKLLRDGVIKL